MNPNNYTNTYTLLKIYGWVNKLLTKRKLYLLYIAISLLGFLVPIFLPLFMFVFPTIFLIKIRKSNFLFSLIILSGLNILLFIFVLGTADLVKIPLNQDFIASINLFFGLLILTLSRMHKLVFIDPPDHTNNLVPVIAIYLLFVVAFVVRVLSIKEFSTPILHDPIAHSLWAKSIAQNESIDFFYSPGLHLIVAFLYKATNISIPYILNIVTNSFNALSVLTWGLVTLMITRNKIMAVMVSLFMFIIPIPSMLYVNSGKNALIFAIMIAPIIFFAMNEYYKKPKLQNSVLLFVSLAGLFLIHYPTFGYIFLIALSFTALSIPLVNRLICRGNLLFSWRKNLYLSTSVLLFVIVWFMFQTKQNPDNLVPINYGRILHVTPALIKQSFLGNYTEFKNFANSFSTWYIPVFGVALLYLVGQQKNKIWAVTMILVFWILSTPLIIRIFGLDTFTIIRETGLLLFFQAFTMAVALTISLLWPKHRLSIITRSFYILTILVVVLFSALLQYTTYKKTSTALETVNRYDLKAYQWINDNNINGNFIINETRAKNNIIYPTDGGMWLPVYTKNDVTANFLRFSENSTKQTYRLYENLKNNTHLYKSLNSLINLGYVYYYADQPVFGTELDKTIFNDTGTLIYKNKEVSIYKLNRYMKQ